MNLNYNLKIKFKIKNNNMNKLEQLLESIYDRVLMPIDTQQEILGLFDKAMALNGINLEVREKIFNRLLVIKENEPSDLDVSPSAAGDVGVTTTLEDIIAELRELEKSYNEKFDLELKAEIIQKTIKMCESKKEKEIEERLLAMRIGRVDMIDYSLLRQTILINDLLNELKMFGSEEDYISIKNKTIKALLDN